MNKKNSIQKKILNSNFKFTKNFLFTMIAPLAILLVGVIMICTLGFNLGTDFTGASSVKIYVNNESTFVDKTVYDLDDSKDYQTVYGKVKTVFEENGLKIVSYRTSTMKYDIVEGQAVEIVFQNSVNDQDKINEENDSLRSALIAEFDYSNYQNAISSVDYSPASSSFSWAIGLLASIVFGLIASIVYMMFRYDRSAWMVLILQVAFDLLLLLSLISICRLTINLTVGIAVLATFIMTILNAFAFYSKMKENVKSGKFANMKNDAMADKNTKEGLYKKTILYSVMIVLSFLLSIISVEGVREVALALVIALITTFFTSTFFTPAVWSVVYKEKKQKQIQK